MTRRKACIGGADRDKVIIEGDGNLSVVKVKSIPVGRSRQRMYTFQSVPESCR